MVDDAVQDDKEKSVSEIRETYVEEIRAGDSVAKHFIFYFAWFWSIASVAYFFSVTFIPTNKDNTHFADIILGFLLGTAVASIIGFFFGSAKNN